MRVPVDVFEYEFERLERRDMKKAQKAKVAKVMREYKKGTLRSGVDPKGPRKARKVTSRRQAVAIALSQAGVSRNRGK